MNLSTGCAVRRAKIVECCRGGLRNRASLLRRHNKRDSAKKKSKTTIEIIVSLEQQGSKRFANSRQYSNIIRTGKGRKDTESALVLIGPDGAFWMRGLFAM